MINAIMFIIFSIALLILFKEIKEHIETQRLFHRKAPIYNNKSIWYSLFLTICSLVLAFVL